MLEAEQAIALRRRFPGAFGLRGFPGDTFRVSCLASYTGDDGALVVYTQRWNGKTWVDFAKGSEDEIQREMTALPILGADR